MWKNNCWVWYFVHFGGRNWCQPNQLAKQLKWLLKPRLVGRVRWATWSLITNCAPHSSFSFHWGPSWDRLGHHFIGLRISLKWRGSPHRTFLKQNPTLSDSWDLQLYLLDNLNMCCPIAMWTASTSENVTTSSRDERTWYGATPSERQ